MNRRKVLETLEAINSIHTDSGFLPTVKELRVKLDLKSNSPVVFRLKNLIDLGLVSKKNGLHTITITKEGDKFLKENSFFGPNNSTYNWQPRGSLQLQVSGTTIDLGEYAEYQDSKGRWK